MGPGRVAYPVIRIAGIILLRHLGRLELPVAAAISLSGCRTRLTPLALVIIPSIDMPILPLAPVIILSIGIPVLLPGTRPAIETVGMVAALLPLTGLGMPAVSLATRLVPLTVLAMPTIGIAAGLLPAMRLTPPAVSIGPRLGPLESLAIPLPGEGTARSRLGCQRDQYHKQGHRKNNAPPFFQSHFLILLTECCTANFWLISRRPQATAA